MPQFYGWKNTSIHFSYRQIDSGIFVPPPAPVLSVSVPQPEHKASLRRVEQSAERERGGSLVLPETFWRDGRGAAAAAAATKYRSCQESWKAPFVHVRAQSLTRSVCACGGCSEGRGDAKSSSLRNELGEDFI